MSVGYRCVRPPHVCWMPGPELQLPGADAAYVPNSGAGELTAVSEPVWNNVDYVGEIGEAAGDGDEDWLRNGDVIVCCWGCSFSPGHPWGFSRCELVNVSDEAEEAKTCLKPREQDPRTFSLDADGVVARNDLAIPLTALVA
jgi:hypothetical protein